MAGVATDQSHLDQNDEMDFDFELDGSHEVTSHRPADDFDLELDGDNTHDGDVDSGNDGAKLMAGQARTAAPEPGLGSGDHEEDSLHAEGGTQTETTGEEIDYEREDINIGSFHENAAVHASAEALITEAQGTSQNADDVDEIGYDDDDRLDSDEYSGNVQSPPAAENPSVDEDTEESYGNQQGLGEEKAHADSAGGGSGEEHAGQDEPTVYFDAIGGDGFEETGEDPSQGEQTADASEHGYYAAGASGGQELNAIENGDDSAGFDQGVDRRDAGKAAAPPEVKVIYHQEEYSLFASPGNDDPNSYFLLNVEVIGESLSRLLSNIRSVISDEVSVKDEILIRVDELGLEFGETTTKDFLDQITLGEILELHDRLVKNDDPELSQPLYLYLLSRPNSTMRLADLMEGANAGKGLSTLAKYYESGPVADESLEETDGDGLSQDITPGEGLGDPDDQSVDDGSEERFEGTEADALTSTDQTPHGEASLSGDAETSHVGVVSQPDADYSSFDLTGDDGGSYQEELLADQGEWVPGQDGATQESLGIASYSNYDGTDQALLDASADPGRASFTEGTDTALEGADDETLDQEDEEAEVDFLDFDSNYLVENGHGEVAQTNNDRQAQKQDDRPPIHENKEQAEGDELHADEFLDIEDDEEGSHLQDVYAAGADTADPTRKPAPGSTDIADIHEEESHDAGATTTLEADEFTFEGLEAGETDNGGDTGGSVNDGSHEVSNDLSHEVDEIDWDNDDDLTVEPTGNPVASSGIGEKRQREEDADLEGLGEENDFKRRRA